jgi:putative ABC transport system permease protein
MLKNNFKIAWRNLTNNNVYSTINIMGLAAGHGGGTVDWIVG